jgi:alkylmercury lyase
VTAPELAAVASVISKNPVFEGPDARMVVAAYKALANGEQLSIDSLARTLGRPAEDVRATIERCNVEFDDEEIVGFGGLSIRPTCHEFFVRGRRLYTWCAWDPLFIAPILGEDARVGSTCPVTGDAIALTVGPSGITDTSPRTAALSMRIPDEGSGTDIRSSFCSDVLLFASADAAHTWTASHPNTFVLEIADAFELGQMVGSWKSTPLPMAKAIHHTA